MAVKHVRYRIELSTPTPLWIPSAIEWCHDNCLSTWDANYIWWPYKQNYSWLFSFDEEYDKAAFILTWL